MWDNCEIALSGGLVRFLDLYTIQCIAGKTFMFMLKAAISNSFYKLIWYFLNKIGICFLYWLIGEEREEIKTY